MTTLSRSRVRLGVLAMVSALLASGCGFTPYDLPLPGGADLGDRPYMVKAEFRDAMDLVPQGGVRSSDVTVGRITDVELKGWTALITMEINGDTELPDNTQATIRQTSLLGEKFVSLDPPEQGGTGRLGDGDVITLANSGRNPELEEVLSAAAMLFSGGGLDQINTISRELSSLMDGRESELRDLIQNTTTFTQTLDTNKAAILTALEKVDRFAKSVNAQEEAIDEGLRDIPPALEVLDDQRDEIVEMLEALNKLGDVATKVIKRAREDTITDLRRLEPFLKALADSGDSLVGALRSMLAFPFTDEIVKDSVAQALAPCPANTVEVVRAGACYGDYWNIDVDLALNDQQAIRLIQAVLSLEGIQFPELFGPAGGAEATTASAAQPEPAPAVAAPLSNITDSLQAPGTQAPASAPAASARGAEKSSGGGICGLVPLCRTPAVIVGAAHQTDLGRILVGPVVAE